MSQSTGPADESDVISALSALANQAELHQGPSGGQPTQTQEDDLFAPDAPLPPSPSQQLLHLPDYSSSLAFGDKDLRGQQQKTPARDVPFDADAVLERYYRSGGVTEEGDMLSVAGPSTSAPVGSPANGHQEPKPKALRLTLQPFASEWIKANYEPHATFSIPRDAMFKSYVAACEAQNIVPVNSASFGKSVKAAYADGVVKMRRLGERGKSRYNYSGLRPSNDAEEQNVRKFASAGDTVGSGGRAIKTAGSGHDAVGRTASPKIDPALTNPGDAPDGSTGASSTPAPAALDKGKKRAPETPENPIDPSLSSAKKARHGTDTADWSSSTQEGRYIVALNHALDSLREAVPALRAQNDGSFVDGLQPPRVNGRVTTLTLARDYILHLQQERAAFQRERERHERETRGLEEFIRGGGTQDGLAEWRRAWEEEERSQQQLDAPVSLEDHFNAQHEHNDEDDNMASLEAFARQEHGNLFHSPSLEDQFQSLHQQQDPQVDQQHDAGGEFSFLAHHAQGSFGSSGLGHESTAGPSSASGRLATPGDSLAFMSAIASEPAYHFDPTTGTIAEDAEDRRRERILAEQKERNKAKQARYRLKQKAKVKALEAENRQYKGDSAEPNDGGAGSHQPHHDSHEQHDQHDQQHAVNSSNDLGHLIIHHDEDDAGMTQEEARMLESIGSVDPSLMEGLDENGNLAALSGMDNVGVSGHDLSQYHA